MSDELCRPPRACPIPASARSIAWRTAGRPGSMSRSRWPARRPSSASSRRTAAEAIARAARLELLDRARIDEGLRPHRPHHRAAGLGTQPRRRRTAWRLGALGRHHAEHHPDRRSAGAAPGARRVLSSLIGEALTAMADLAERGADMPIAGRTHGQHAVPATFGYKVAVWIDELIRHVERLRQAAPRIFVAMLGGGAGTFASLGEQGPPVQAGIGRQLGMLPMAGAVARARRSPGREYLSARHAGGDLRQDRPRDLHADEDRVRRGRGTGAARHRRQFDHAAEAQSQTVPGHHRRVGRGARDGAAGAGGDADRA